MHAQSVLGLPFIADRYDLAVWEFVVLLDSRRLGCYHELLLEIEGDIAQFLLDITNDFPLCRGGERVAALCQILDKTVRDVAPSKIEAKNGVRKRITLIDRNYVGYTISGIHDNTGCASRRVQGKNCLDLYVESRRVEGFEHDLGHLLPIGLGVARGFSKENWVLFRSDTEFIVEGVMPDLLHVVPVGDNSMLDRIP